MSKTVRELGQTGCIKIDVLEAPNTPSEIEPGITAAVIARTREESQKRMLQFDKRARCVRMGQTSSNKK